MKNLSERELRELLTIADQIAAPADLAQRIKAEIPDDLHLAPEASLRARRQHLGAGRWLALAASLAAMVGGSFLAYRLLRQPELSPVAATAPVAEHRAGGADEPRSTDRRFAADRLAEGVAGRQEAPEARLQPAARGELAARDAAATATERNEAVAPSPGARPDLATAMPPSELPAGATRPVATEGASMPAPSPEPRRPIRVGGEADITFRGGSPRIEPEVGGPPARDEERALEVRRRLEALPREERGKKLADADHSNARVAEAPPPAELIAELKALEAEPAPARRIAIPDPTPAEGPQATDRVVGLSATAVAPPSTGGTAEPNDAPYGDVFFRGYGTNPFIDTEDDPLSTFGLDVDTGSYAVVRRYLRDGHLPPPDAVRVEELVNYFDYGDPPPKEGDFAIHAEGAPSVFAQGERYHLVRFNLRGREIDARDRRPALLTFVVDVSGSMARESRLGLVKEALGLLLGQLKRDDRVALVVYGTRGRVVLEPTGERGEIRRAIDRLVPEGSTNAEEGLRLAYDLAARHRRRGRSGVPAINRVILCSDGVANVGRTSAESILGEIRRQANQGIELTTVGFGMGNYNDVLMERLADTGNGRYAYVDSLDEARRIFVEGLTGTLQTIAAEARVQVEWNPETVARYRLLGYENRDIADERFRDDTVDAGEIGAGHTVTALYEIKLHKKLRPKDRIAVLHLRWGSIAAGEMVELSRPVTGADFAASWEKASPALRLTSLVAEFAEILKGTYWAREGDLEDVFRRAQKVSAEYAGDREVADFVSLVGRAADHRREDEGGRQ